MEEIKALPVEKLSALMLEVLIWPVEIEVVDNEGKIVGFSIVVILVPFMLEIKAVPVENQLPYKLETVSVEILAELAFRLLSVARIGVHCPND